MVPEGLQILRAGRNNIVVIPRGFTKGKVSVSFRARNAALMLECDAPLLTCLIGHSSLVYVGEGTTFTRTASLVAAEGAGIFVGRNCVFASDVRVSNTDGHAIFDGDGNRVNPSKDVIIGEHVWLAREANVMKGARIGSGSVVGAKSMVTGTIPKNSICVGTPAKVVRGNATFTRFSTLNVLDTPRPAGFELKKPLDLDSHVNFAKLRALMRAF